ncbi:MAG: glycosyltransferase [Anaerolineae bacterium]|nr:glycosyltransferase [Caldilineales bacterium]MDW8269207.1 glycosyltransferase [Anaerolineae bacterium]
MRILFVAPFGTCRRQTVSRRLLPLAVALAAGHDTVQVLVPAWDCRGEAGRMDEQEGVRLVFPAVGPRLHPLADPFLLRRLYREAMAFRPDIVHVSKGLGYAGLLAWSFARREKPRVYLDLDDLETAAGWGRERPWLWRHLLTRQERELVRRVAGVTVAAIALRPYVTRQRPDHALYLPNGVIPAPTPAEVAANPPVVLVYTRGHDVEADRLAGVWAAILARTPTARLRLLGDWTQAPSLPQSEHLGWRTGEALTAALRSAAVALFPVTDDARTRAKSPARLLDCLAHGLPVVTADVGEYGLLTGRGGVVVPPDDDEALVEAVVRLLTSPEQRGALGQAAWRQAHRHTWAQRAALLRDWYTARP